MLRCLLLIVVVKVLDGADIEIIDQIENNNIDLTNESIQEPEDHRSLDTNAKVIRNEDTLRILQRVDTIIKSPNDDGMYRGLELGNKLKVLLISDPNTDYAAAAMDVNVGYLNDPDEVPGLAHFCEHLLFMGTKEFPEEDGYNKFLTQHGGSSNASTHIDHTTYYFNIIPEHLKEALERFAQFFISPLFCKSAIEGAIKAVNSEFEKNIKKDDVYFDQILRHLSDPDHQYRKFGTGNITTLKTALEEKDINLQSKLQEFYDKWYSSNIMTLTVVSNASLDDLEKTVVSIFSSIKNQEINPSDWTNPHTAKLGTKTCIVPIDDVRLVSLSFPITIVPKFYKNKTERYISSLVGHEGPGSILSELKSLHWATGLSAGVFLEARGIAKFDITVWITEEGSLHIDDIVKIIFEYFNMLRANSPSKCFHDEQRKMSEMHFKYQEGVNPTDRVIISVHRLQEIPFEDILYSTYDFSEWSPDKIVDILEALRPQNAMIIVTDKKCSLTADKEEPLYKIHYANEKISSELNQRWEEASPNNRFHLPAQNDYIPSNYNLDPLDTDITDHPVIIYDKSAIRIWHKQDDIYLLPKTNIAINLVSPLPSLSPLNVLLNSIFSSLFWDSINEYMYSVELAGLSLSVCSTQYGLEIQLGGFSDKQPLILKKVFDHLLIFKVDPKKFEIFKEAKIRELENFSHAEPFHQSRMYLSMLLSEGWWTQPETLTASHDLSVQKLEEFITNMLSHISVEGLVHGNANKESALKLVNIIEDYIAVIKDRSDPPGEILLRDIELEDRCNYLYTIENDTQTLSSVELYYQCGLKTIENYALLSLFVQIIKQPCFDTLRTKEKLGYIVISSIRISNSVQGLRMVVQSDQHPTVVEQRMEAFLESTLNIIKDLTDGEFNNYKAAISALLLLKPTEPSEQTHMFWMEIVSKHYGFNSNFDTAEFLRTLTKDDLVLFFWTALSENGAQRRKLAIHVISQVGGDTGTANMENQMVVSPTVKTITNITGFKNDHEKSPRLQTIREDIQPVAILI